MIGHHRSATPPLASPIHGASSSAFALISARDALTGSGTGARAGRLATHPSPRR